MPSSLIRIVPVALALAALYLAAVCTTAGQAAEETVFMAWRHLQVAGGPRAFALTGQVESAARLVPPAAALVVVVAVVVSVARRRDWRLAGYAVLAGGGALVTTELVKLVLPHPDLVPSDFAAVGENTLPSGHVTIAAATVLIVSMLVPARFRDPVIVLGSLGVAVLGVAVVSIAWHRTSDVLAALLVVAAAALLARRDGTDGPLTGRRRDGRPLTRHRGAVLAGVLALVLLVMSVVLAPSSGPVTGGLSSGTPAPVADLVLPIALITASACAFAALLMWRSASTGRRR